MCRHALPLFLQVLGTNNGQVATLQFKPSSRDQDWDSNNWFTNLKVVSAPRIASTCLWPVTLAACHSPSPAATQPAPSTDRKRICEHAVWHFWWHSRPVWHCQLQQWPEAYLCGR